MKDRAKRANNHNQNNNWGGNPPQNNNWTNNGVHNHNWGGNNPPNGFNNPHGFNGGNPGPVNWGNFWGYNQMPNWGMPPINISDNSINRLKYEGHKDSLEHLALFQNYIQQYGIQDDNLIKRKFF